MLVYLFFVPVCVGCTWPFAVYEERSKLADFELVYPLFLPGWWRWAAVAFHRAKPLVQGQVLAL